MGKKASILQFSPREKKDLIISWLTLSLAFSIVVRLIFSMDLITSIVTSLLAVGTGFVLHELAHREAAKSFGFHSEYRAWYPGLIIALALAFISGGQFIFAAPGATYFFAENVSRKQNGIISVCGPLVNLIIGTVLLILSPILGPVFSTVLVAASMINFSLAFFNLIPIFPLDGSKVIAWKPVLWVVLFAFSALLVFAPGLIFALVGIKSF